MEKPIRILHVLGRLDRGGAETMVMNLYRNIDRTQIQFDFIIHTTDKCDYNDEIEELGGKIYTIPRYTGKNHFYYKKAWHNFFQRHTEYELIHGHVRSTASIYVKIAKKYSLKTIVHSHSISSGTGVKSKIKDLMQLPIRSIADYLFACSDEAGKWLFGKNVVDKENYKVIKNAIDVEKYVINEEVRKKMLKDLQIEGKFVLGHVGRFSYEKNHEFLIEVFYELQKQCENAVLLLVGDGELKPKIEEQIYQLGIQEKVILTGSVSNVHEYMQAMDVFVFPSHYEGLGMVAIEAQASGLPCVISDRIPKQVIVTEVVTSLPLSNASHWVGVILDKNTPTQREGVSFGVIKQGYDIRDQVENLKNIYFDILSN